MQVSNSKLPQASETILILFTCLYYFGRVYLIHFPNLDPLVYLYLFKLVYQRAKLNVCGSNQLRGFGDMAWHWFAVMCMSSIQPKLRYRTSITVQVNLLGSPYCVYLKTTKQIPTFTKYVIDLKVHFCKALQNKPILVWLEYI